MVNIKGYCSYLGLPGKLFKLDVCLQIVQWKFSKCEHCCNIYKGHKHNLASTVHSSCKKIILSKKINLVMDSVLILCSNWCISDWTSHVLQTGRHTCYRLDVTRVTDWTSRVLQTGRHVCYRLDVTCYRLDVTCVTDWTSHVLQTGRHVCYRLDTGDYVMST